MLDIDSVKNAVVLNDFFVLYGPTVDKTCIATMMFLVHPMQDPGGSRRNPAVLSGTRDGLHM